MGRFDPGLVHQVPHTGLVFSPNAHARARDFRVAPWPITNIDRHVFLPSINISGAAAACSVSSSSMVMVAGTPSLAVDMMPAVFRIVAPQLLLLRRSRAEGLLP